MTYQPKVVRCRLKMGGKSIEEIRAQYTGQGMTYRDFENIQRANEQFDGLVLLLSLWDWDNYESYHLHNWEPTDDERMMKGIYYSEQVHPYTIYKNDFERFRLDWKAGNYESPGVLNFAPADVEEIEVICEEVKRQEYAAPSHAPVKPKHKKRKRRRK